MISFSLKNEHLKRLINYCNYARTDQTNLCTVSGNDSMIELNFNELSILIPVEYAITISSVIYQTIITDCSVRRINLNEIFQHKFRNSSNASKIMNLLEDNDYTCDLSNDDVLDFFEFGCDFGCSYFMIPLIDIYSQECTNDLKINQKAEIRPILDKITNTNMITRYFNKEANLTIGLNKIKDINCQSEITYIARHFYALYNNQDFIKWCAEPINEETVETIIKHRDLQLQTEDSLMRFILDLSRLNNELIHLLSAVLIEFCSVECISEFIDFIHERLESNAELLLFINCLGRRCLKLSNGVTIPEPRSRYSLGKEIKFSQNDPLRGIFFSENEKGNVTLTASSVEYPDREDIQLSDLLKIKEKVHYFGFWTQDERNASITALLKGNKSFTIKKYTMRGTRNSSGGWNPKSWILKGQLASTKEWIEINRHDNDPAFNEFEIRTYDVNNDEKFVGIKFEQTGPNGANNYHFGISGFDVFGKVFDNNW